MQSNEEVYLRRNIKAEPLVDQWYAWSHLIPPATSARNITERHLKIMDSYISAPLVHANAVKNPQMLGGPFVDYGGKRVDEIRALRDKTKRGRTALLELSAALQSLDAMLRENAKGFSLQPLYPKVPDILRGYVELAYDLNNHPSFRLIEPLLYRSKYYDRTLQSIVLSFITEDHRPFVLSTPRLESDDSVHLPLPFDHEAINYLFQRKTCARPWGEIAEKLNISQEQASLARSFYTTEPPPPYVPYTGSGVRWRYFGHACILIESQGLSLLFDPVLSYAYDNRIPRYTYRRPSRYHQLCSDHP